MGESLALYIEMLYLCRHFNEIKTPYMRKIKNDILHVKGIDVGIYTEDYRNEYI
jgi:hypothetical protein